MTSPAKCSPGLTVAGGRYYWTCACGVPGPAGGYHSSVAASKGWAAHVASRRASLLAAFGRCAFCGSPRHPDPTDLAPPLARRLVCTDCGEVAR